MGKVAVASNADSEVLVAEHEVERLSEAIRGTVLVPDAAGYEEARRVWNGMIDHRPAVIVRCRGTADVIQAVSFAREHDLLLSVRGGGHSAGGRSMVDRGFVIDLAAMTDVRVDPAARVARAGGGTKWGDLDRECQAFGLATTGGTDPDTGVAGLTLGGGIGWLACKYGLACDNLVSVDLVTAEAELLTVSAEQHPDLFWAIRGAGHNFGVVTSFEYRLHPVGPLVYVAVVVHPLERARDALCFYREFTSEVADEVNTAFAFGTSPDGDPVLTILACHFGPVDEGERVLDPLRRFGPPVVDDSQPMPYLVLQELLAETPGRHYYWKDGFVSELDDGLISAFLEPVASFTSPFSNIGLQQLGNAARRVPPGDTAFSNREAKYWFLVLASWEDPTETDRHITWLRRSYETLRPSASGSYINALGWDDGTETTGARDAYLPATYQRLTELKGLYDPANLFRSNANIQPSR
jgi:hypothetical protein